MISPPPSSGRDVRDVSAKDLVDPATGLLSGLGLVQRGRELVALMARQRAALACLVFTFYDLPPDAPATIATAVSRVTDAIGSLDGRRFAIIAPDTDEAGAVKLAERLRAALRPPVERSGSALWPLRVGYCAVSNVGYEPIDSPELVRRAAVALERGAVDLRRPWVRRFEPQALRG